MRLAIASKNQAALTPNTINGSGHDKTAKKATRIVLVICFAFIVFTIPSTILFPIYDNYAITGSPRPETGIVEACCMITIILNHSLNFVLYVVSSMKFRKILVGMLCSRCQTLSAETQS